MTKYLRKSFLVFCSEEEEEEDEEEDEQEESGPMTFFNTSATNA
jgi:hypothetical protein